MVSKLVASVTASNSSTSMSVKLTSAAMAKSSTSTDPPVVPALSSLASAKLSATARVRSAAGKTPFPKAVSILL